MFDCYNENSKLFQTLKKLQKTGKINNFLPQLYYDQTSLIKDYQQRNTPFAFYGSPLGLHVDKDILDNNLDGSIAMSIFGGIDRNIKAIFNSGEESEYWEYIKSKYTWTEICMMNIDSLSWVKKAVGTTGNPKHMQEVVDFFDNKPHEDTKLLRKISIQSCSMDHMAVVNAEERWNLNNERLRSKKVYYKSLAYHFIKKNRTIFNIVNTLTGRNE